MSAIIYKIDKNARESLASGVRQLGELVTITLGPKGGNVALDRRWNSPQILHDGVSVAKSIELEDPFENMGAQLVKEAASKTVDRAGDGTTTSTLLAWKMIEKGMRLIDEGVNPMMLKEGMDIMAEEVVDWLNTNKKPLKKGDIENVATISAADAYVGSLISEAIEKVGEQGVITVEKGLGEETSVEYKDGMMFDKGYAKSSPAFITNSKEGTVEILNPMILYTDMIIDSLQDFTDFLDNVLTEKNRSLVIICDSFEGYTLPTLIENHKRGAIRAYAVPAPSFGIKRLWMLEDMATLTGGTVISRQSGRTLSSIKPEELGHCDKVWADADNTKIIGGHGIPKRIKNRVDSLKEAVKREESEFEKRSILERIARLTGGVAIIKVGALSEAELEDRTERIKDAVEATKAALAEGIIAGGGVALLQCHKSLHRKLQNETDPDRSEGIKLVLGVLTEPIQKILRNAGKTPEIIIERILQENKPNFGYDIIENAYGDMYAMGIIDPSKVTRQAFQNAVSVASMILTIEALITKSPNKNSTIPEQIPE